MRKIYFFLSGVLFFLLGLPPNVGAETISLKFSYKTNTINTGDIFRWIDSYNQLWKDWQNRQGGILEGQLKSPEYKANYEFELRLHVVAGFSLTLAGSSQLQSRTEGTVYLNSAGEDQEETHFISNTITALPFKIGLSYRLRLPGLSNFSVNVGAGRLIIFAKYENFEDYTLQTQFLGTEYNYWYKTTGNFKSECLGLYVNLTTEYALMKFVAIVLGFEQRWAKMDGFKGSYTYTANFEPPDDNIEGKASLYFYESKQWGTGDYYSVLSGHIEKPVSNDIQNIRQGKINLGGYSFIIGIRLII